MNKKTAKALEKSIAHWKWMHDAEEPDDLEESPEGQYCALCQAFSMKSSCNKCPVMMRTGQPQCGGSPWQAAFDAFCSWDSGGIPREEWRKAARKEIKFLESLREPT